jgi:hypothetical protein
MSFEKKLPIYIYMNIIHLGRQKYVRILSFSSFFNSQIWLNWIMDDRHLSTTPQNWGDKKEKEKRVVWYLTS